MCVDPHLQKNKLNDAPNLFVIICQLQDLQIWYTFAEKILPFLGSKAGFETASLENLEKYLLGYVEQNFM